MTALYTRFLLRKVRLYNVWMKENPWMPPQEVLDLEQSEKFAEPMFRHNTLFDIHSFTKSFMDRNNMIYISGETSLDKVSFGTFMRNVDTLRPHILETLDHANEMLARNGKGYSFIVREERAHFTIYAVNEDGGLVDPKIVLGQ